MIVDKETSHYNSLCNFKGFVSRCSEKISDEGKGEFSDQMDKTKYDDHIECVIIVL